MSIHTIGILGLVAVFVFGTIRPVNLGALALVATYLVGTFVAGEAPRDMFTGFPVDLFVLLAGVTYLFAVASTNGTIERIIDAAAGLVRSRRALIPWMVFVVASLPAMTGALGSAGVAMFAPIALGLASRYDIDRRMIGLMVIYGAGAGNFSPLNPLGVIVMQTVTRAGLTMSPMALFIANVAYNAALAVVIYFVFGGRRLHASAGRVEVQTAPPGAMRADQVCTVIALLAVAAGALMFGLNVGFLAFAAAVTLQLVFPKSGAQADRKIAWSVVLLVCGVVTYVAALQRYGTVQAIGDGLAGASTPMVTALLIAAVGAVSSAFASSAGILGAMIPLAVPFMAQGQVETTGFVIALALSATVVDAAPFSTVGALIVANAREDERAHVYRGLLLWGLAMVLTAPLITWLLFVVLPG